MVTIEGKRVLFIDPNSIKFVSIFDLRGECLYKGKIPISGYVEMDIGGNADYIIIINLMYNGVEVITSF